VVAVAALLHRRGGRAVVAVRSARLVAFHAGSLGGRRRDDRVARRLRERGGASFRLRPLGHRGWRDLALRSAPLSFSAGVPRRSFRSGETWPTASRCRFASPRDSDATGHRSRRMSPVPARHATAAPCRVIAFVRARSSFRPRTARTLGGSGGRADERLSSRCSERGSEVTGRARPAPGPSAR
jgi:hypothetical protein